MKEIATFSARSYREKAYISHKIPAQFNESVELTGFIGSCTLLEGIEADKIKHNSLFKIDFI